MEFTVQKIGTTELLKVKKSGRRYYLVLSQEIIDVYGLDFGDVLKVKIEELRRPAGGERDE